MEDYRHSFSQDNLDEKSGKVKVLATGLPASPGAAVGQIVFTADDAVVKAGHAAKKNSVILVHAETTPEDIHGTVDYMAGTMIELPRSTSSIRNRSRSAIFPSGPTI